MKTIQSNVNFTASMTLVLDEEEVRAFNCLAGYEDDAFLTVFYPQGDSEEKRQLLRKHEEGLKRLLGSVRNTFPGWIRDMDQLRKRYNGPIR